MAQVSVIVPLERLLCTVYVADLDACLRVYEINNQLVNCFLGDISVLEDDNNTLLIWL